MSGWNAGIAIGGVTSGIAAGGGGVGAGGAQKGMITAGGSDAGGGADWSGSSLTAPHASGASTASAIGAGGAGGIGNGAGCGSPSSASRRGAGTPSARIGPRRPSDQSPASGSRSAGGGIDPAPSAG